MPGDIAVAGFDDERLASLIKPSLTTIGVPRQAIGEKVASVVLSALRGAPVDQRIFDMGFTLVEREVGLTAAVSVARPVQNVALTI